MNTQKRNKFLLGLAIVLLSGNLVMLTIVILKPKTKVETAKKEYYKNHRKKFDFEKRMATELDLSNQQLKQYHKSKKVHMERLKSTRDSIRFKKRLIHNELMKKEPNLNYINKLSDSIGFLNAEFEKLNYLHFYTLKKELTPEQLEKFNLLLNKLPEGKEPHRE